MLVLMPERNTATRCLRVDALTDEFSKRKEYKMPSFRDLNEFLEDAITKIDEIEDSMTETKEAIERIQSDIETIDNFNRLIRSWS